jgi:hypothetical protein
LIEVYLRAALGPVGWEILEFLREYRLVVYATVVGGYVAFRLFRWAFDLRERTSEGGDAGGCLRTSDTEALESSTYGAGTFEEPLDERVVPPAAEEQEIREGEAIAHQVAVPERPEGRLLRDRWV